MTTTNEIDVICAYLISDEIYREEIKRIFISELDKCNTEYKLILRWMQDVEFPEIDSITLYIKNEKYIYRNAAMIRRTTCTFLTFVLQCISNIEKLINKTFLIMQKYGIIGFRNLLQTYVIDGINHKRRMFTLGQINITMPFENGFTSDECPHGEAHYLGIRFSYNDCINGSMDILLALGGLLKAINILGEIHE